ncbi:MAG: DUF2950 domain-containing protein [Candidatus Acidiferrales bacterium]
MRKTITKAQLCTTHAVRKNANLNPKGLKHMETRKSLSLLFVRPRAYFVLALLGMLLGGLLDGGALHAGTQAPARTSTQAQAVKQQTFATPQEAVQALVEASKVKDQAALTKIFGPDSDKLFSGDPVEDNKDLEDFAAAAQESLQLQKDDDSKYTLLIGKDNWPTPIPIVQKDGQWFFDTKAGLDEVLNRRIGENELSATTTCRAYVVAQWEYFTGGDWGHDGVAAYAPRFISSPGAHDGLYWETPEDDKPSPLGQLVAEARAEGYGPKDQVAGGSKHERHPYHGYYFKILTQQGPHAPGGKYNYIINGNMIAGFALVAYPDKWGDSGVMTFIVNQQGRLYEKNLGENTAKIAGTMTEYNPEPSWTLVKP